MMTDSNLIALISLLLSTFTIFIAFCIFNQEKSTQTWLAANLVKSKNKDSGKVLFIGGTEQGSPIQSDADCIVRKCRALNLVQDFSTGLNVVPKLATEGHGDCYYLAAHTCVGDSLQGLGLYKESIAHYRQALLCNESEIYAFALERLSYLYIDKLNKPHEIIVLLDPHVPNTANMVVRRQQLSCVYAYVLYYNYSEIGKVLELLDTLRKRKVKFGTCLHILQHSALMQRQYHADAYQFSKDFVHQFPAIYESHAAMGDALLALGRLAEAGAVLNVSYDLFQGVNLNREDKDNNFSVIQRWLQINMKVRLADALNACGSVQQALAVYSNLITEWSSALEPARLCVLLTKVGGIYYARQDYNKAYVALLQSTQVCRVDLSGYLLLGKVQQHLGLPHDAADSFRRASAGKYLPDDASSHSSLTNEAIALKGDVPEGAIKAGGEFGPEPRTQDPRAIPQDTNNALEEYVGDAENEEPREEGQQTEFDMLLKVFNREAEIAPALDVEDSTMETAANSDNSNLSAPEKEMSIDADASSSRVSTSNVAVESEEPPLSSPPSGSTAEIVLSAGVEDDVDVQTAVSRAGTGAEVVASREQTEPAEYTPDRAPLMQEILSTEEVTARKVADQYILMARAYLERKDAEQALKQLGKAVKRAPGYADCYLLRGQVYASAGYVEKATEDFLKVFRELDPFNATAAHALKQLVADLALSGQLETAGELLASINGTLPRSEEFGISLASVLSNKGEFARALEALDSIEPHRPSSAQRVGMYVQLFDLLGQADSAERVLLEAATEELLPWSHAGEWYLRQENFAQALNSFERHLQFLQKQPGPPTPAGKSEIAAVHKKVGSLYTHLYTSTSTFLDDASANAATEAPVTNIDQLQQKQKQRQEEYLEKAAAHYLEAMKAGIYDVEIRRFFAHHAPTTAQVNATASATSANETVEISFKEPAEIDELGMSEQEILQQLQGFEPHGATDAERISSDKRARRTEKGSNEKESATRPTARTGASTRSRSVTASAAATVTVATGALHRRRSRWVVRHLSAAPLTSIDAVEHVPTSLLTLQKSTTITSAALPEEEEDLQSTFTGGLRAHDSTTGGSLEVEMRRVVDAAEAEGTETPFEVQRRRQEELQASEDVLNVQ